jgi:hypothetical protein
MLTKRQLLLDLLVIAAAVALFSLYSCWRTNHLPSPYPAPNSAPPIQTRQTYKFYLPWIPTGSWLNTPSVKKGVSSPSSCADAVALRASWIYDWSPRPMLCPGIDSVPMVWGGNDDLPLDSPAKYVLLFNEPDQPTQANLTPAQAVTLAHQIFLAHPGKLFVSPAPSQVNPQWLIDWYNGYIAAYGVPPPIVGIGVHCYNYTAQNCIDYVASQVEIARGWGVEVFVTEFAFSLGMDRSFNETLSEMQTFIDYLESEPIITHYAWFTTRLYGDKTWYAGAFETVAPLLTPGTQGASALTPWGQLYGSY